MSFQMGPEDSLGPVGSADLMCWGTQFQTRAATSGCLEDVENEKNATVTHW